MIPFVFQWQQQPRKFGWYGGWSRTRRRFHEFFKGIRVCVCVCVGGWGGAAVTFERRRYFGSMVGRSLFNEEGGKGGGAFMETLLNDRELAARVRRLAGSS